MTNPTTELWILLEVLIAALLSGVIGYEREKFNKPAGLKTNMIVGSIACYLVANSNALIAFVNEDSSAHDPLRLIQAIIIGVSFIGAGTIWRSPDKNTVLYLTTAATLLYSASIGIAVALHQYYLAVGLTLLIILINGVINYVESKMIK